MLKNEPIQNMKTWAEVEKYLARHGWGLEQIALAKKEWKAPTPAKPTVTKPS